MVPLDLESAYYWVGQKARSGLCIILWKIPNEFLGQPNVFQLSYL